MRVHNAEAIAETQGIEANNFQFEMNAKMYDMLISKLYKNKAGAVIRELSANAWDAHVEAGNEDKPFELHLPTWLDKTFSIRDYGTGIPHDKFEFIYTNIGKSTKEGTNELIGGFGLGSKTPFTLTDTFTVENIHRGRKTTWLCFKSGGEPKVSRVGDEETTEPSGLLVSFAFTADAVSDFTREVVRQLRYFPVRPTITGGESRLEWPEFPDGWETMDYFYVKDKSWNRSHYVVMGNVCYTFDSSDVDHDYRDLFHNSLTLKMDIGDVDIPPSREHLELTDRTKKALNERLDKILKNYQKDFDDKVAKCDTFLELRKLCYNTNSSLLDGRKATLTWKGNEYYWRDLRSYQFKSDVLDIRGIMRSYKQVYRIKAIPMDTLTSSKITLYVNDLGRGFRQHINDNWGKIPGSVDSYYIIEPPSYRKNTKDTIIKSTQQIGKATFSQDILLLSSVLGFPTINKGGPVKAKPNQFFTLSDSGYSTVKSAMEPYSGDVPTKGYYIPINGWSTNDSSGTWDDQMVIHLGRILSALKLNKTIYLVRMASVKEVEGVLGGPKDLLKYIKPKASKIRDAIHKEAALIDNLPNSLKTIAKYDWSEVDNSIVLLLEYKKKLEEERVYPSWGHSLHHYDIVLGNDDRKKVEYSSKISKAVIRYQELYDELFQSCNYGYYGDRMITALHKFLKKCPPKGSLKKATSNTAQTNVNV